MKTPRSNLWQAGAIALVLTSILGFVLIPPSASAQGGPGDPGSEPRPDPCFTNLIHFQATVLASDPANPVVRVFDPTIIDSLNNLNPDYDHQADFNFVLTDFVIRGAGAPGGVTLQRNGVTTILVQEFTDEQHMESSNFTTGIVFEPNDLLVARFAPNAFMTQSVISITVTGYQCRE